MNYKYTIIYSIFCLLLFWLIIKSGTIVINKFCFNKKLVEGLTDFEKYSFNVNPYPKDAIINYNDRNSPLYNHTVNLPLTDRVSCQNFCGPNSICSITGEQCTSDIDCYGCKKKTSISTKLSECIPGDNDAGKLTLGVTPQYSTLTTDIGTQAALYTSNLFKKPAMANFGVNTWFHPFKQSSKMFDKRYVTPELQFMPNYAKRYTATGQFMNNGPIAANGYI
jgi:hypothetical protein